MSQDDSTHQWQDLTPAAGNGLFDRRPFFKGGASFAAAMTGYTLSESAGAQALVDDPWSAAAGTATVPYESPSRFESAAIRTMTNPNGEPRGQQSRTPHHLLNGTFTPNGLHFVISRSGAPDTSARSVFSTCPSRHAAASARRASGVRAMRRRPDVPRPRRCTGEASGQWRRTT